MSRGADRLASPAAGAAAWHDVECASYRADLPLWRELAGARGGPVLDLGCGTGRVALDLAAHGHEVTGVDSDPELVRALTDRAKSRRLAVKAHAADVRRFDLGGGYPLALAAMQVVQLLGGAVGRGALLACVARHLAPGGLLALALANPFEAVPAAEALPPLPDVLELDGWVLSSTPVAVRAEADAVAIERQRQAVSPTGELIEEEVTIRLEAVTPAALAQDALRAGYSALSLRQVPATSDYVGSSVVLLEAPR